MKLGFFHDHQFVTHSSGTYTTGTLHSEFWRRYFVRGVSGLVVCGREKISNIDGLPLSSSEGVEFMLSPSLSKPSSLLLRVSRDKVRVAVRAVDVVIARLPSEIGLAALEFARHQGKSTIVEVVACANDALTHHGTFTGKLYAPFLKRRMQSAVSKADAVLYVTSRILQERYPNSRLKISASNVEIFEVRCTEGRVDRFEDRRARGAVRVGLTGTLSNNLKGIDVAIKALAGSSVSLHIFGGGDTARFLDLAERYNVNAEFHGFIAEKNELLRKLDNIDIYIQPSLQEGLPRATIEAMSRGCPVLSSDAGGLVELVKPEFVHKRGDAAQLRANLESLLCSDRYMELSEYSLSVASKYLFDRLTAERTEFYEKVIHAG